MQAQFYKILGKYYYESHREIADGTVTQWCNEIDICYKQSRIFYYQNC